MGVLGSVAVRSAYWGTRVRAGISELSGLAGGWAEVGPQGLCSTGVAGRTPTFPEASGRGTMGFRVLPEVGADVWLGTEVFCRRLPGAEDAAASLGANALPWFPVMEAGKEC